MICESEKLTLNDDEAFKLLIDSSEGDMRKAITTLQSCSRLSTDINQRDIFEVNTISLYISNSFCNQKVINENIIFYSCDLAKFLPNTKKYIVI